MEYKKVRILNCKRCGYSWTPRKKKNPKHCARCNSPYWNKPKKEEIENFLLETKKLSI